VVGEEKPDLEEISGPEAQRDRPFMDALRIGLPGESATERWDQRLIDPKEGVVLGAS
jgi:hypothetical protein